MLLSASYRAGAVDTVCALLLPLLLLPGSISVVSSLARVDSNWSHRRPNITVAQNQRGQPPVKVAVAHNQTMQWQRNNQTHAPPYNNTFNRTLSSAWQQPSGPTQPLHAALNQTWAGSWGQNAANRTQQPTWAQQTSNQTHYLASGQGSWSPQSFNGSQPAVSSNTHLYPVLPNTHVWTPAANQTLLYPQIPGQHVPQVSSGGGNNNNGSIPLAAPLQPPQQNAQGPHNWHSGGQAILSYGPGYNSDPATNTNKNPANRQATNNPYANMFI